MIKMRCLHKKDISYKKRSKSSHKGDNGKVLIIGGSEEYSGAVAMAGMACLRAGADLVTIAAPEKIAWAVNCLYSDLITIKLKGKIISQLHLKKLKNESEKYDVIVLGNGAGLSSQTNNFFRKFTAYCSKNNKKMVIDADAIKCVDLNEITNSILTPHKKEFEILLKNSRIKNLVLTEIDKPDKSPEMQELFNKLKNNIIVLKGEKDYIFSMQKSTQKVFCNKTGNPGMTVAGTGDVLAGMIAGFLAQGLSLEESAKAGTYYNGVIGDHLKKKKGYSYIASDIIQDMRKCIKDGNS